MKTALRTGMMVAAIGLTGDATLLQAQTPSAPSLHGTVSSVKQEPMEGVLVSAKKDNSTITTTVVSDRNGQYTFPTGRLSPGRYRITIRAIGFDLVGSRSVTIPNSGRVSADLTLAVTKVLGAQLTNTEWAMSMPGTDEMKKAMYSCSNCHTYERIVQSKHTANEFLTDVLPRMANYSSQAFPLVPQTRLVPRDIERAFSPKVKDFAKFLADTNLSRGNTWPYALRTLPRPTGKATRVIFTEYELPSKTIQPHDVVIDKYGMVWYSNFSDNDIGRLDPKSGKVAVFRYQGPRGEPYANGNLDLEFDKAGNIWVGLLAQAGIAKFDLQTEKFRLFPIPKEQLNDQFQTPMVAPTSAHIDGKVWLNNIEERSHVVQVTRLDLKTLKLEPWISPYAKFPKGPPHSLYDLKADSQNNAYFTDFSGEAIGRVDAKTKEVTLYPTPTPRSRPRRGQMDKQDRFWFAEWAGNVIGMFDTKTRAFKEWKLPTPHSTPYDVSPDRWGNVWTGGMNNDRITRLNPSTGEIVEYLLPRETNVRRTFVDNRGNKPVFWVGSNHQNSIVKLEPLD